MRVNSRRDEFPIHSISSLMQSIAPRLLSVYHRQYYPAQFQTGVLSNLIGQPQGDLVFSSPVALVAMCVCLGHVEHDLHRILLLSSKECLLERFHGKVVGNEVVQLQPAGRQPLDCFVERSAP